MTKKNLFEPNPRRFIEYDHNNDGIDRRGFLTCMAWAGTGGICVIKGEQNRCPVANALSDMNRIWLTLSICERFCGQSTRSLPSSFISQTDVAGTLTAKAPLLTASLK